MHKKPIRTIITIFAFMLVGIILWFAIDGRIQLDRSSEREAELERRAVKYEKLYLKTDLLYSKALESIERTEAELAEIREVNSRLRGIESELRAENRILERTINELGELHSELAEGTGRAEELIRAIDAEARRVIESLEKLYNRSNGTN